MLVELRNATFGYGRTAVVHIEQLTLEPATCIGIFGPNGSGKTTLVRGIASLIAPMNGIVVRAPTARFGYLPQHRSMDLHWPMTAFDAASMAMSAGAWFGWIRANARQRVRESMNALAVRELEHQPFARLSGGQQQRVLLAGALSTEPNVLVLDEPTDGLDVRSRGMLLDTIGARKRGELCAVMISHEVEDLLDVADVVAWLHPPLETDQPSEVELINPQELARRVTTARRAS
jgi:zinc transport system ATP-binding protein